MVKTADGFKTAVANKTSAITVVGDFKIDDDVELPVDADITLNGSGTITADEEGGIKVPSGAKLTINSNNLTLDGGGSGVTHTVPFIWSQGELTLKAGTIQNFTGGTSDKEEYLKLTGVNVVYIDGNSSTSTFTMDGGTIQKNATTGMSYGGAGVKLVGKDAYMTMNGGSITQNSAQRTDTTDGVMGGGVLMFNGGTFTMNGGTISDNVAGSMDFQKEGMGGGVAGIGLGISAHMVMNGGTISGNKALSGVGSGHGGGVMMHTNTSFVANGGSVTNNETTGMGGGLYVDGIATDGNSANRFYNTIITGNTATNLGGGLWICPTGCGSVSVTRGAAIYGNSAPVNADKSSAGDDFVVHPRTEQDYKVTLADRMLGGGKAIWYKDGGLQANRTNESGSYAGPNPNADPSVPRYDAANPGDPVVLKDDTDAHALKNVTTEGAQNLANRLGKVMISGNKAKVGGGVATNQMISFGGDKSGNTKDLELKINKYWDDSVPESQQKDVTVALKIGDEVIDTITIKKDQQFEAFGNVPNPDGYEGEDATEDSSNDAGLDASGTDDQGGDENVSGAKTLTADNSTGKYGVPEGTPYLLDKDGNRLYYSIEEIDPKTYDVVYGTWVKKLGTDGFTTTLETSLTNSLKTGDLSVTKKVEGKAGDKIFTAQVKLKAPEGSQLEDSYEVEYKLGDSSKSESVKVENGVMTLKLEKDQAATIKGLPAGTTYTVTEKNIPSGFELSRIEQQTGQVKADEPVAVVIHNKKKSAPPVIPPVDNKGDLDIEKKVVGEGAPKDAEFTFTITTDPAVKDGTYGDATFKDGVATIVLKAGQTAHIKDLPKGTKYTVTEAESKHFISSIKNGSGTITAGKVTVTATNTYEKPTGDLEIGKTVKGEGAPNASFTFDITLTDADGKPVSGTFSGITFEDGHSTVTLKAGEKAVIEGLPAGTSYKVTERAIDGFTPSIDGAVGTIPEDGKAVVSAVNTYEPKEPEKPVDPDKPKPEEPKPDEPDKPSKPEKPGKDLPQTGDSGMSAVALTAVALSGAVLVAGGAALLKKRSSR